MLLVDGADSLLATANPSPRGERQFELESVRKLRSISLRMRQRSAIAIATARDNDQNAAEQHEPVKEAP